MDEALPRPHIRHPGFKLGSQPLALTLLGDTEASQRRGVDG